MIVFKKVRWKNFLSTGNNFIEVGLDKNHTTLVVGENGAGKSTILDALTFSLYGKSFRKINKAQLINSSNEKDCFVLIEFSINGDIIIYDSLRVHVLCLYQAFFGGCEVALYGEMSCPNAMMRCVLRS